MDEHQSSKNNEQDISDGMSAVQKQLAEYRNRMSVRKPTPTNISAQTLDNNDPNQHLLIDHNSNSLPAANKKPWQSQNDMRQRQDKNNGSGDNDVGEDQYNNDNKRVSIDIGETTVRSSHGQQIDKQQQQYIPPQLKLDVSQLLESKDLIEEFKSSLLISSSGGDLNPNRSPSIVCINSIPVLNVFDMTRTSHNMRRIRQGSISQPQDLESEIRPDEKI